MLFQLKYTTLDEVGQMSLHLLPKFQVIIKTALTQCSGLQVCEESGLPLEEIHKQTMEIVNEMAHNLSINAIRGFAVFLVKVMKALFRRIYVNEEGIQKVRS